MGGLAFGKEEKVGFDARARRGEDTARQADDAPQVAIVQEFAFGFDEGIFVGAEEQAFIQDDAAAPAVAQAADNVLEEEDLGGAGFVVEVGLGFGAFFAAEGRIGEDDVEGGGRALEEAAVDFLAGEGVAVPEVGFVDAVEDEVGQGDGVDEVLFFPAPEGALFEGFELFTGGVVAEAVTHVFKALGMNPPVPQPGS